MFRIFKYLNSKKLIIIDVFVVFICAAAGVIFFGIVGATDQRTLADWKFIPATLLLVEIVLSSILLRRLMYVNHNSSNKRS